MKTTFCTVLFEFQKFVFTYDRRCVMQVNSDTSNGRTEGRTVICRETPGVCGAVTLTVLLTNACLYNYSNDLAIHLN